jgi:tetratricopeptide (TPR) repeat protein
LATYLQPRTATWGDRAKANDMLTLMLGDGRRMFANHFYTKADVYFHNGYYPSIFDQAQKNTPKDSHMSGGHDEHDDHDHEEDAARLNQPKDWVESFGRRFYPSTHTHLEKPEDAKEILPWLKISADLDPQRVQTYTTAAFWLRSQLGKVAEAEEFLREGLRANPDSYEILYELGRLYAENHHDQIHARNLWELALRRWNEQEVKRLDPNPVVYQEIATRLAMVEEELGNYQQALYFRELEKKNSPMPEAVQQRIDELKQKMASKQAASSK